MRWIIGFLIAAAVFALVGATGLQGWLPETFALFLLDVAKAAVILAACTVVVTVPRLGRG